MTTTKAPTPAPAPDVTSAVTSAVAARLPQCRAVLEDLVAIPSVSSQDPDAVDRSAAAVAAAFADLPGVQVQVLRVPGVAPAVLARRPAPPGAPTVLLYAHHDVQPTGDLALWTSPPFRATERDGRLYGRGSADDKAGVTVHLAALLAHLDLHGPGSDLGPGIGVSVLVEGEEEIGSPGLARFLDAQLAELACDVLVVADSDNAAVDLPALTTTLRGLCTVDVTVTALAGPVHSGVAGGAAPDPVAAMTVLLAGLWDADGAVAVPGLPSPSPAAIAAVAAQQPPDEDDFRRRNGIGAGPLPGRGTLAQRLALGYAATVIGMDLPDVAGSANVVQASCRARIGMRVPPGADPAVAAEVLRDFLLTRVPWGMTARVDVRDTASGYAADTTGPGYRAARSALAWAWGVTPVDIGLGGSIPFIADLVDRLPAAEVLVTGVEDPASRPHGIDESLHLGVWERSCLAEALLLEGLAAAG